MTGKQRESGILPLPAPDGPAHNCGQEPTPLEATVEGIR
jgi:hypothetical protein